MSGTVSGTVSSGALDAGGTAVDVVEGADVVEVAASSDSNSSSSSFWARRGLDAGPPQLVGDEAAEQQPDRDQDLAEGPHDVPPVVARWPVVRLGHVLRERRVVGLRRQSRPLAPARAGELSPVPIVQCAQPSNVSSACQTTCASSGCPQTGHGSDPWPAGAMRHDVSVSSRRVRLALACPEEQELDGNPSTVIELDDAVAVLGGFPVLAGATLTVGAGEIVLLRGPNGAGKTSLLRLCAGLLPIVRGTGRVLGFDLATERDAIRPRVGLLGHSNGLYADLSVAENVGFWGSTVGASSR